MSVFFSSSLPLTRPLSLSPSLYPSVSLPVGWLSGAVSELPRYQHLVAAQRKLGPHQEASVKVGEAVHLQQRGHRGHGSLLLLRIQLGLQWTGRGGEEGGWRDEE